MIIRQISGIIYTSNKVGVYTMEIGTRVKTLRKSLGLTQKELAEKCGYKSLTTINKIELGINSIPLDTVEKLAHALEVTPAYLMGWKTETIEELRPIQLKKFRMLGEIACGEPIFANEDHETYIDASAEIKADFCLTAKGDSMTGARIFDGDIVFIREQAIVENGQIAAVVIGEEVTLKRWYYYPEQKKLVLQAENPRYEPFVFIGEELNNIRCLGRAVSFMSNL